MRLFLGMILGAGLAVGLAYIHDASLNGPFQSRQRLVNWDVAGAMMRKAYDGVRTQVEEWTGN